MTQSLKSLKDSVKQGYDVTRHELSDELKELTDDEKEMIRERHLI